MNTTSTPATITPTSKFVWLLKREFWEYRGSFLWAPAITATVMLVIMMMALLTAEVFGRQHGLNMGGIRIDELSKHLDASDFEKAHAGIDIGLLSMGMPIAMVLFIVTFFYCLGSLYNDRADRSVLFWKSMPLSDTETVLAKVVMVAFVAPLFAIASMIALQLGFLVLMSLYTLMHGLNVLSLFWSPTHLVALWVKLLVVVPVNALWALPSIGWLMMCSSYARSKPFLWAMVPIVAGFLVSWMGLMQSMALTTGWFWRFIVGRALLSLVPGSWMDAVALYEIKRSGDNAPEAIANLLSFDAIGTALTTPDLWIGAAAGAAMIAAAVYFRRGRIESFA
jgi:ABC-2 type transport system permease protein